jgi:hypothetical protein
LESYLIGDRGVVGAIERPISVGMIPEVVRTYGKKYG